MIDWEQRRMTLRAASRLTAKLETMCVDSDLGFEPETQDRDSKEFDAKFRSLYANLVNLVGSLKL